MLRHARNLSRMLRKEEREGKSFHNEMDWAHQPLDLSPDYVLVQCKTLTTLSRSLQLGYCCYVHEILVIHVVFIHHNIIA